MTRWITNDEATAQALRRHDRDAEVESGSAIARALVAENSLLFMPADARNVIVARIERKHRQVQPATQIHEMVQPAAPAEFAEPAPEPLNVARWESDDAVGYQAGGMLGLLDEPVYEEEKPEKKKWWKRILD